MKKFVAVLSALILTLSLAGCEKEEAQPDFATLGINQWISASSAFREGTGYNYLTECEEAEGRAVNAMTQAVLSIEEYGEADSPDLKPAPQGYHWVKLKIKMVFSDENANNYGYSYSYITTDYYDIKAFKDSMTYDDKKGCENFTVRSGGKKYKCVGYVAQSSDDWVMTDSGLQTKNVYISWTMLLPEGYDGICCGVYNHALEAQAEGKPYFNQYYSPEDFMIFRLD